MVVGSSPTVGVLSARQCGTSLQCLHLQLAIKVPRSWRSSSEVQAKAFLHSKFALKVCNVPATFAAAIALLTPSRSLQARLAQSVERKALNLVVVGSRPTVGVCPVRSFDIEALHTPTNGFRAQHKGGMWE